ncbi:MAG: hypothetical protein RIQ99_1696 [Pseudomonadota bacterium]
MRECESAAVDDRFAQWPRGPARAVLAAFSALFIAAMLVPISAGGQLVPQVGLVAILHGDPAISAAMLPPRDPDLVLYDRVIERIGRGEDYYHAATAEHRAGNYPLRPGVAVRLPTLAYLDAWLGPIGQSTAASVLLLAVLWAWWRRLGDELPDTPAGAQHRRIGTALMFFGGSLGLNRSFFVLHELWAGMLLALALGLHRPGRQWAGSLAVAALALAIREHALPFVLLMAALAAWRRAWPEALAWAALIVAFGVVLAWHLQLVAQHVVPGDPVGPSWLAVRGLSGWLSAVALSSNLRVLPHFVAGPLVLLMVLGWAGWRSSAGAAATLLFLGYGLALMIAGRPNNFYWGAVIAPAMFIGLAFAPRALASLWASARGQTMGLAGQVGDLVVR